MAIPGLVRLLKIEDDDILRSLVTTLADLADHSELHLTTIAPQLMHAHSRIS
jgi:hypothetical protein